MVLQNVKVTVSGVSNVQRYLRALPHKIRVNGKSMTKRVSDFIVRSAKQRVAPMKTGTGTLMRSIKAIPIKDGYKVVAGDGAVNFEGKNYARFQEFGFSPHWVGLKKLNRRSRLYGELSATGARKVFVRRWTPFMGPAFRQAVNRLGTELNRTANKIIRG